MLGMRHVVAVFSAVLLPSAAWAWEYVELMSAYGDKATGIVQASRGEVKANLAIGCDGDRFRLVAIAPGGDDGIRLSSEGQVRFSFDEALGAPGKWQVRKRPDGRVMYLAPAPTDFVRLLVSQVRKDPTAVLRVGVRSAKRNVVVEFPLAGLPTAVRHDLWVPCKLENYFPDPESEAR